MVFAGGIPKIFRTICGSSKFGSSPRILRNNKFCELEIHNYFILMVYYESIKWILMSINNHLIYLNVTYNGIYFFAVTGTSMGIIVDKCG